MLRALPIAAALLGGAALASAPGPARSAPFAGGELVVKLGPLPPVSIEAGAAGVSNPSGSTIVESAGSFGPADVDLPDSLFTGIPQISDLRVSGVSLPTSTATLATGFTATTFDPRNGSPDLAGAFGGTAPLTGTATICILGDCGLGFEIPLGAVGRPGTVTYVAGGRSHYVRGGAWTTGTVTVTIPATTQPGGRTPPGVPLSHTAGSFTDAVTVLSLKRGTGAGLTATPVTEGGGGQATTRTLTLAGSDLRDAGGEGSIQLVSPGRIDRASDRGGTQGLFAVQTLAFVPEPGPLALLGLGTAALAAAGRRRLR